MKRYFNKLMTCALACAICLSAAVPAFAAESKSELNTAAARKGSWSVMKPVI